MTDLSVIIAGVPFKNPVIAASGTFGYGSEYDGIIDVSRLGGICTKGLTIKARPGNYGERIWETSSGLLNSIGLENPGIPYFLACELPRLKNIGPVIIANLCGETVEEYEQGAQLLNSSDVDMVELNISCPNVKAGGMAFGLDPRIAGELCAKLRQILSHKPLIVKLSPNAPSITAVAVECAKSGADAFSLVNTFKAMAIDIQKKTPIFNNIIAGLSGPAIKPIALRMVWELYGAFKEAKLKQSIIGIGGISCTTDAVEFLMAGAAAIQVGSATFSHPAAMIEIIEGLEKYLENNELSDLRELAINRQDILVELTHTKA
jgi:dihydroorotate dehydrogenase (NAD+) catalytic subunit